MITGGRITSVVLNKGKSLSLPLLWGSNMSCALNASFMSFYSTTFLSLTNAISSSSLGEYFNKVPHLSTSLTLGWWWLRETMINPLCCSLPLRNVCWFCPLFQLTLHCKMAANSGSETKHCNCTLITPQHSIILPNTSYVPTADIRMLSPQHWAQVTNDLRGTLCVTYGDCFSTFIGWVVVFIALLIP